MLEVLNTEVFVFHDPPASNHQYRSVTFLRFSSYCEHNHSNPSCIVKGRETFFVLEDLNFFHSLDRGNILVYVVYHRIIAVKLKCSYQ